MKRTIIIIVSLIGVCVIGGGVWFALTFNAVMKEFHIQANIVHGGYPIVHAIDEYTEANGQPPTQLDDLIPHQLSQIPTIDHVVHITYRLEENQSDWVLSLFRDPSEKPWEFRFTSTGQISESDDENMIGYVHGWSVHELTLSNSQQ